MEKNPRKITVTETDDGFRVDVAGMDLRDLLSCCCLPASLAASARAADCCRPEEDKK